MKKTAIMIMGSKWKVVLLDPDKFHKDHQDCEAVCYPDECQIFFQVGRTDMLTIIHEVTHAFYKYQAITDDNYLKNEQHEEFMCTFFGKFGEEIIKIAKQLKRRLK